MSKKIKFGPFIAPESDYEIRQLAKDWGIPIAQATEKCIHLGRLFADDVETLSRGVLRQAEAKVEMLKQR